MKLKKIKITISVLILSTLCLFLLLFKPTAYADTPGFSVVPSVGKNQIKPGLGYFNLLLKPNQSQKLEFTIYNNGSKDLKVKTTFGTAFTGDAGNVLYTPEKYRSDQSLKINIKDYVKLPKNVTIPAHSKSVVEAEVTMPAEEFKGVIAGGFNFNEIDVGSDKSKTAASKSSTSITNLYSYVIGLVLQNSEDTIQPTLNLKEVGASQRNSRNIFSAKLENSASTYLLNMDVDAVVTSFKDKKIKYSFKNSSMEMAPNSNFDLAVPVSIQGVPKENETSQPLKPGKYQISMTIFGGKNENGKYQKLVNGQVTNYDYKWTFNKSFIVTGKQSKQLNSKDVTINQNKENSWVLYILIALVVLLMIIIFILLYKSKNKKES